VLGTPRYMSPEQALGKDVDHRSDLFSLGSVIYDMLTGRAPFAGSNLGEVLASVIRKQPDAIARFNFDVPPELERITLKLLAKQIDRRYQSARDLLVDLKNLLREIDATGVPHSPAAVRPNPKEMAQSDVVITYANVDDQPVMSGRQGCVSRLEHDWYPTRPTRLAQLQAVADSDCDTITTVLDAFRGWSVTFVMPGAEVRLDERTVIDLSHESLMRGWERLRIWVEDEAQSARIFRRLLDTARLWSDGKAGLFRDPDLQIAHSWREQEAPNAEWAEQYGGDFETAIGFLETSNADAESERLSKEAARQRELEQARQLAEAQQLRLEQQQQAARRLRKMIAGLAGRAHRGRRLRPCAPGNQRAITLAAVARQNEGRARQNEFKVLHCSVLMSGKR
jgi:Protein kinase domain